MDILELLKTNAEAFAGIPNAAEVVGNVVAKLQELGYSALADSKKTPSYVDKSQYDQISGQAAELGKQLEELKKAAKGNDEMVKTIDELQKKNVEWEGKFKDGKLENAIKIAAMNAKAHDAEDVLLRIDKSKLALKDDNSVDGLDDQLKVLKESKAYLFGDGVKVDGANPAGAGAGAKTDTEKVASDFSAALKG